MHHRKTKAETSMGQVYYTTQQWRCKKAKQHIRDVIRERLAPPKARIQSIEQHVQWLNPKIRGWKNYYGTPHSTGKMAQLDFYIRQRRRWMSSYRKVIAIAKLSGCLHLGNPQSA
jgi:RNA-directed DNA polymerase